MAQLLYLHAQPAVARVIVEGRLTVRGWYYDILSWRIERYDEGMRRFVPLLGWRTLLLSVARGPDEFQGRIDVRGLARKNLPNRQGKIAVHRN